MCSTRASCRQAVLCWTYQIRAYNEMITNLVAHSGNAKINFSPEVEAAYAVLKDFDDATVYVDKEAKREEKKVDKLISELYARLCDEPALMPNFYMQIAYNEGVDRAVTDYISGMSDEFATRLFEELFVPAEVGRFCEQIIK